MAEPGRFIPKEARAGMGCSFDEQSRTIEKHCKSIEELEMGGIGAEDAAIRFPGE